MPAPPAAPADRRTTSLRWTRRLHIAIAVVVPLLYLAAWWFAPDCANGGSDLMATLLIPLLVPVLAIGVGALVYRPPNPASVRSVWLHIAASIATIVCAVPLVVVAAIRLWVSASGGDLRGCLVF